MWWAPPPSLAGVAVAAAGGAIGGTRGVLVGGVVGYGVGDLTRNLLWELPPRADGE